MSNSRSSRVVQGKSNGPRRIKKLTSVDSPIVLRKVDDISVDLKFLWSRTILAISRATLPPPTIPIDPPKPCNPDFRFVK